jgi:hypothetical protein
MTPFCDTIKQPVRFAPPVTLAKDRLQAAAVLGFFNG